MAKRDSLKWIALLVMAVLMFSMLASCKSSDEDALNGVTSSVGGDVSTDPEQESTGGENQNGGTEQEGDPADPDQPATDTPAGNDTSVGNDNPAGNDTPADNGTEEADPYAAMKADQSGTPLKILCQNLRYDAVADQGSDNDAKIRRYRFQELVKKYDPDIIAGQECCKTWINFLQEDYSNQYDMFYEYRGNTTGSNESCPILWKRAKYEKIKTGYFWLSDTPKVSSPSYVGGYPRIVNWVALKDKSTGQEFYIYSTHFSLDLKDEHLVKTRKLFAEQFAKIPNDAYAFVMGDFNISYQSTQYYALTDGITLADLRPISEEMAANGHTTLGDIRKGAYNGFASDDGGVFGDFIMTAPRKHLAVDFFGYCYEKPAVPERGIGAGFVSDHFAVYTEVRMGSALSYTEYFGDSAR